VSKDIISETSSSQTSDILIYNALKKSDHPLLKKFNIVFPSEGALAIESNSIFVMSASEEITKQTSHSDHYNALTEIYVKTKKADYKETSKLLRTTIRIIKNVLKNDPVLKNVPMVFRNSSSKYASKFALKAKNLLVETKEIDIYNREEEEDFSIFFENTEIEE
jgi:hypothetical protein